MIEWMDDLGSLAYWAQAFAILFTGLVAIRAGRRAFDGANVQANAMLKQIETNERQYEADKADRLEKTQEAERTAIKMAATALAAEMSVNIRNLADLYKKGRDGYVANTWLSCIRGSQYVFRQNPYIVSNFPTHIADDIIRFYGLVEIELAHHDEFQKSLAQNAKTENLSRLEKKELNAFSEADSRNLAARIYNYIQIGRRAVDPLSKIAGRKEALIALNNYVDKIFEKGTPSIKRNGEDDTMPEKFETYTQGEWLSSE